MKIVWSQLRLTGSALTGQCNDRPISPMQSPFIDPLDIHAMSREECLAAGLRWQHYVLLRQFRYYSRLLGEVIIVPAGFVTDFASIPNATKWYLDDDSWEILYPSVVHDYLYSGGRPGTDRAMADAVLREAMQACGASADKVFVVYRAVRWFGGGHFGMP